MRLVDNLFLCKQKDGVIHVRILAFLTGRPESVDRTWGSERHKVLTMTAKPFIYPLSASGEESTTSGLFERAIVAETTRPCKIEWPWRRSSRGNNWPTTRIERW
jgi:hypothetical protein